jgi:hypothetical protein
MKTGVKKLNLKIILNAWKGFVVNSDTEKISRKRFLATCAEMRFQPIGNFQNKTPGV